MSGRQRGRARGRAGQLQQPPVQQLGAQVSGAPPPPDLLQPAASAAPGPPLPLYWGAATAQAAPPGPGMRGMPLEVPGFQGVVPGAGRGRGTQLPGLLQGLNIAGDGERRVARRSGLAVYEEVRTRPAHAVSKTGNIGEPIRLYANLFKVTCLEEYHLFQYHVEFMPLVVSKKFRRELIARQMEHISHVYVFDGAMLFLPIKLERDVLENAVRSERDGSVTRIIIKFITEIPTDSPERLLLINNLFKSAIRMLGMEQQQRNYFNREQRISVPQHGLEIWPGFASSILNYERSTFLNIDVAHKLLHTRTIYDEMEVVYERFENNPDRIC